MSGKAGSPPPAANRFRKGQSGNPKGRPRKAAIAANSAFDVIIDRTLTVTQGGKPREVTIEEALQHRTYQDAIAGNRAARRQVLKMIAKREEWLAQKAPKRQPLEFLMEREDPENANEALLVLGIAERAAPWGENDPYDRFLLCPWAVQAALSRRGRRSLSENNIVEIKRCTRDADTLRWPASIAE